MEYTYCSNMVDLVQKGVGGHLSLAATPVCRGSLTACRALVEGCTPGVLCCGMLCCSRRCSRPKCAASPEPRWFSLLLYSGALAQKTIFHGRAASCLVSCHMAMLCCGGPAPDMPCCACPAVLCCAVPPQEIEAFLFGGQFRAPPKRVHSSKEAEPVTLGMKVGILGI